MRRSNASTQVAEWETDEQAGHEMTTDGVPSLSGAKRFLFSARLPQGARYTLFWAGMWRIRICRWPPVILEGEKKRGVRGPATRSAFWGCRACKAARDEAAKKAREARRRNGERRDWDDCRSMKTVRHHRRRWRTY